MSKRMCFVSFDDYQGCDYHNLGDFICSLVLHHIAVSHGFVPCYVRRDCINDYEFKQEDVFVMSGFFPTESHDHKISPKCVSVKAVGFHHDTRIEPDIRCATSGNFGCRDFDTYFRLRDRIDNCYISLCVSVASDYSFVGPGIECPEKPNIFVDCPKSFISGFSGKGYNIVLSHHAIHNGRSHFAMMDAARSRLRVYKSANKVYTTRLHCYLPCIAMGVPCEYIGKIDGRTEISRIVDGSTIEHLRKLAIKNIEHELFGIGCDVHEDIHEACMSIGRVRGLVN